MQPKDSRLKLEIEVANDNALHWKGNLQKAHVANKKLRQALREIAAIKDNLNGGDWDEIEQARAIANEALKE